MAKEWILNSVMNRFQLNFKRNVGSTSESIRKCAPRNKEEWKEFYFANVKTETDIENLGKRLYVKITEVIPAEIEAITERDCIDYMFQLVIDRTFDGYMTEIETIYGQLQQILNVKIEPAPDGWDRLFNVDFYIKIKVNYIGLQVKPVNGTAQITQIYKERALQEKTHKLFSEKYGGKVFYIFSVKDGKKKKILNLEVVEEIKEEINRLNAE